MNEIRDILRIIPKENSISEISSGSGIHDGSQDTVNILSGCVHGYIKNGENVFIVCSKSPLNCISTFCYMFDSCHIDNNTSYLIYVSYL